MGGYKGNKSVPYLLLLPSLIVLLLFLYWPTLEAIILSFYRQAPFGARKIFVKFQNYVNIFTDSAYLSIIIRTLVFISIVIILGLSVSLILASLVNQKLKGIKIYRTIFFIPYAISPVIAGSLWVFLLNPVAGHINYILNLLFNIQPRWLTDGKLAFAAVCIATIWKNMGFNII